MFDRDRPEPKFPDLAEETRASDRHQKRGLVATGSSYEGGLCPYLGCREWAAGPETRPSRRNVCFVKSRIREMGINKIKVPYSAVSRKKQASTCLRSYSECHHYQEASSKSSKDKTALHLLHHEGSEQFDPIIKPSRYQDRIRKNPRRAHSLKKRSHLSLSKRWRTAIQFGAVVLASGIAALGLSVLLSANPASFVEYLFQTVLLNDIKAFGLKHKETKDRLNVSGIVTGGNLRPKKILSKSDKRRLKNSAIVQNLSEAQKKRIKKQLGIK